MRIELIEIETAPTLAQDAQPGERVIPAARRKKSLVRRMVRAASAVEARRRPGDDVAPGARAGVPLRCTGRRAGAFGLEAAHDTSCPWDGKV